MAARWLYGWGLGSVALGGASLAVPLYVVELGGGPFALGVLAAVAAVVGVPAALGAGRIADRTGKRRAVALATLALVAVALAAIPLTDGVTRVVVANGAIWLALAAATPVLTLLAVADVPESAWSDRIALLNRSQGVGWALVAVALAAIPLTDGVTQVVVANGAIWFALAAATPVLTLLAVADVPESAWSDRIALLNRSQGVGWALGLLLGAVWTGIGGRFLPSETVIRWLFVPLAACAVLGLVLGVRTLPADPGPGDRRASGDRVRRAVRAADRFSVRTAAFPFTVGRADFRGLHPRRSVERVTPALALYFAAALCFFAGFGAFFAPLPAFLTAVGFGSDGAFALYLTSALAAAASFGVAGRLTADRDAELSQIASLSTRGAVLPAVALVGVAWGASALGFAAAALGFAAIGLTWAVIAVTAEALVARLSPLSIRGEAFGTYAALGALAGGAGGVGGGWLAARSYAVAFGAAGGLALLGATLVVLVRLHTASPMRR